MALNQLAETLFLLMLIPLVGKFLDYYYLQSRNFFLILNPSHMEITQKRRLFTLNLLSFSVFWL